jgi:ABC-2 type transport system permease protein
MKSILLIVRREFTAYFKSPLGYIIIGLVLFIDGLLFNVYALGGEEKFSFDVLRLFFYFSSGTTMIASVFISMRLLAEERQTKTIVLLYTSPIKESQIIIGKFLSGFLFLFFMTILTIYMPLLIFVNGKVSFGHIIGGYLGILLLGSASLAIGVFGSSLAKSQILAAIISGGIIVTMLLFWKLAQITDSPLNEIFAYLSLYEKHFIPFMRGIVNTRSVIYYLVVTYFFLFISIRVLEARRWR